MAEYGEQELVRVAYCMICGREFITNKKNIKLCSEECKKAAVQRHNRRYYEKKREKRIQLRAMWSRPRTCLQCSTSFVPHHKRQVCCSEKCQRIHHSDMMKDRREKMKLLRVQEGFEEKSEQMIRHELHCAALAATNAKARAAGMSYGYYVHCADSLREEVKVG